MFFPMCANRITNKQDGFLAGMVTRVGKMYLIMSKLSRSAAGVADERFPERGHASLGAAFPRDGTFDLTKADQCKEKCNDPKLIHYHTKYLAAIHVKDLADGLALYLMHHATGAKSDEKWQIRPPVVATAEELRTTQMYNCTVVTFGAADADQGLQRPLRVLKQHPIKKNGCANGICTWVADDSRLPPGAAVSLCGLYSELGSPIFCMSSTSGRNTLAGVVSNRDIYPDCVDHFRAIDEHSLDEALKWVVEARNYTAENNVAELEASGCM